MELLINWNITLIALLFLLSVATDTRNNFGANRQGGKNNISVTTRPSAIPQDTSKVKRIPKEQLIHDYILTNYSKEARPETKNGNTMVLFQIKVSKLNKLDVKEQELSVTAFTLLRWHDSRLLWDPSEFNGVKEVNLGNTLIWTPDIVLYNDAHDGDYKTHTEIYRSKVQVMYGGNVIWNNPVRWISTCEVDVTWFPMDRQVCNMTFGSWSYNERQLHISFKKRFTKKEELMADTYHIESGEWLITRMETFNETINFVCCGKFSTITYSIHLRRYPLFYFIYIFLPLLSQLVLFLVIFHIPPDTGERLGFGITILLNITMYMILISEKLPEKSDKQPMLGLMFVAIFYLLSTGLAISAITMLLSRRKTEVPKVLQRLFFQNQKQIDETKKEKTKSDVLTKDSKLRNKNEELTVRFDAGKDMDLVAARKDPNWNDLMKITDKIFFYLFLILLITVPIAIFSLLDKKGLMEL